VVKEPSPSPEPTQVPLRLRIEGGGRHSYPLRKVLELLQSTDVHITMEIEDKRGELARKQEELDRLLNDYGVIHKWDQIGSEEGEERHEREGKS